MRIKENSDLEFNERVNSVFDEIKKDYPLIDENLIYQAAAIARPIDDKTKADDIFDRYYILMYLIGKEDAEFPHVYNDAYNLYSKGLLSAENSELMDKISEYVSGYSDSFPEM